MQNRFARIYEFNDRNKDNIKIQQIQLKTALNHHVFVTVKL